MAVVDPHFVNHFGRYVDHQTQEFGALLIIHIIIRLLYQGPLVEAFMVLLAAESGHRIGAVLLNLLFTWLFGFWGGLLHYLAVFVGFNLERYRIYGIWEEGWTALYLQQIQDELIRMRNPIILPG